jgi:hypothetical protein
MHEQLSPLSMKIVRRLKQRAEAVASLARSPASGRGPRKVLVAVQRHGAGVEHAQHGHREHGADEHGHGAEDPHE